VHQSLVGFLNAELFVWAQRAWPELLLQEVVAAAAALRRRLDLGASDPMPELIRFATLAANSHNTQPWHFQRAGAGLRVRRDPARRTPAVDPDDHHVFASLGCAAENLMVAASAFGLAAAYEFDPLSKDNVVDLTPSRVQAVPLLGAIPKRQCRRSVYDGRSIPAADPQRLREAASIDGVDVALITERSAMNRVRDAVVQGNRLQMLDEAFVRELKAWIRFSASSATQSGDGLFAAASGNPVVPDWLGGVIFPMAFTVDGETSNYQQQMDSSAGVAVFAGAAEDPQHWALAGRAYQRFALQAVTLGVKHAFINQPVEVPSLRAGFANAVGFPGRRVDLVVRSGYAADLPFSLRRPVSAVVA
jgi:hypothetical protein